MSAPTAWPLLVANPQALRRLYDDVAGLDNVTLLAVELQSQLRRLRLRFDLPRFADRPAPRWHAEANTVQVTLDCFLAAADDAPTELRLRGAATEHAGRLTAEPAGDGFRLTFASATLELRVACGFLHVAGVSAYIGASGDVRSLQHHHDTGANVRNFP